ncbi:MAG: alpha/beta hydrolase, partial [Clostridia bacterium]|nr:alpha/beta hydrolase [Clostridia bacterium]
DDRADEGAGYKKGGSYNRHRSGQYFDVYVPAGANADTPVMLYLHGGSWCQEYDKDDESAALGIAQGGFLVISMDYILQVDVTANSSATPYPDVTFAAMVRDVDAMVSHMKTLLPSLGLKAQKFAIAGGSAGAHLAALYAWDAGAPQVMGLSLRHEMPVGFMVSVGGPLDMSSDRAVQWMNLFKNATPNMARLIAVLSGGTSADQLAAVVKTYSPLALINEKTVPSVIAYSHLPTEQDPYVRYELGMRGDGIVEGSSYDNIVAALEAAGVPHANKEIVGGHCSVDSVWMAATMRDFAQKYL